jgi:hypothetical protein
VTQNLRDVVVAHFGSIPVEINDESQNQCQVTVQNPAEYDGELDIIDALNSFPKAAEKAGWYITQQENYDGDIVYTLHPIKGRRIAVTPQYVYHTTSSNKVNDILNHGLKLSRGGSRHGFKYPPRIFFTQDPTLDGETMWSGVTVVLKIDTSKVPNIELYVDPQFDDGGDDWISAYSTKSIPPEAISVL